MMTVDERVRLCDEVAEVLYNMGAHMKAVREAKGISKWELAKITGMMECTITNLEAGRSGARLSTVLYLANALGVGVDEYIGYRGRAEEE